VNGRNRHIRATGGFTLLEILVVLIIATLLFTLIPPLFSGALPGVKLKGAARDLVVVLRATRSQAIITNTEQTLHHDMETRAYRVGSGKPATLPDGITISIQPHASASGLDTTHQTVSFFPDGSSSGGQLLLQGGSRSYKLDVDWLTGKIRIEEASVRDS
jgi:general secretion pathway protein H